MAKAKQEAFGLNDLVDGLIEDLAKEQTSGRTITAGDLGQHTYGQLIPHIAAQYVVGGSNIIPAQRYLSVSGPEKSMKSTLMKEIGCWYQGAGGLYDDIDNEGGKTSASMFEAMSCWRNEELANGRHLLTLTNSVEEWQNHITTVVNKLKSRPIPAKGKRLPVFIAIDSLTGSGMQSSQEKISEEGHAQARSYDGAATANAVSQFIQNLNLRGTTVTIGTVRHQAQVIDDGGGGGYGPKIKESGAKRVNYQNSVNLRVSKAGTVDKAGHPSQHQDGPAVEGYTIRIVPEASCLGSTVGRAIEVDVLWQYVLLPDGSRKQHMWYDWDGALGRLLWTFAYHPKLKRSEFEIELLKKTLYFSAVGKDINCEELGLQKASQTEFGRKIRENPEIASKIQAYLAISCYPTLQEAEIEVD